MPDLEKATSEMHLAKDAYKSKDFDGAVSHYLSAAELNPKEMSFVYHAANIKFEQGRFADCVKFYTKAIKLGKEHKANVKMVAKAMAMRGKAFKELGEMGKFKDDIEKAVKFLSTIARVKFEKEKWLECIDFSDRVIEMSQENGLAINADILASKSKSHVKMGQEAVENSVEKKEVDMMMQHFKDAWKHDEAGTISCLPLKCAEMLHDQAEFERCAVYLGSFIPIGERFPEDFNQDDVDKMRALQGRALRRLHGFDVSFDTKPWLEFVPEDNDSFATMDEFKSVFGGILGDNTAGVIFRMADFDGDGRADLEDLQYLREALEVPTEERSRIDFRTLVPHVDAGPKDLFDIW